MTKHGLIVLTSALRRSGASTQLGEWCEMHHGENWGDFVMIMMLLLVSIIIYCYMKHLLLYTSALLTCCLPFFSILIYQLSLHANSA